MQRRKEAKDAKLIWLVILIFNLVILLKIKKPTIKK